MTPPRELRHGTGVGAPGHALDSEGLCEGVALPTLVWGPGTPVGGFPRKLACGQRAGRAKTAEPVARQEAGGACSRSAARTRPSHTDPAQPAREEPHADATGTRGLCPRGRDAPALGLAWTQTDPPRPADRMRKGPRGPCDPGGLRVSQAGHKRRCPRTGVMSPQAHRDTKTLRSSQEAPETQGRPAEARGRASDKALGSGM